MRRSTEDDRVAEVTRRRLEALARELGVGDLDGSTREDRAPGTGDSGSEESGPGRHARRPVTTVRRLGGWLADRTPTPVRLGLRSGLHLGAAQLGVVALVVALGLLLTAWWIVSGRPEAGPVVPPRPVAPPMAGPVASADPADPRPAATQAGGEGQMVVVDVAGRVRRPGIVVLPLGSRVVDAVEAAGGLRRGARPGSVNLARLLVDGEQIVVGQGTPPTSGGGLSGGAPGGPSALVNLNTADAAALESLPGVGPVTARAILTWRAENGGFTAIDQLLDVSGIGEATLAEIAPHVTL